MALAALELCDANRQSCEPTVKSEEIVNEQFATSAPVKAFVTATVPALPSAMMVYFV